MIPEIINGFENYLDTTLSQVEPQGDLTQACRYMLLNQGKRIRPLCYFALLNDLGEDPEKYYAEGASIELIHTASLVHDDLPAMDNDDIRRGKPSCHVQFNEATAILTGDFLQALAFFVLSKSNAGERQQHLIKEKLALAFMKICQGQMLDMNVTSAESLGNVHSLKTAALFRCTMEFAGLTLKFQGEKLGELGELGELFGMYFQLMDDYLDVYAQTSSFTRPYSSDIKNKKVTLFSLGKFSLKEALAVVLKAKEKVEHQLVDCEQICGCQFENLREVIKLINQRIN